MLRHAARVLCLRDHNHPRQLEVTRSGSGIPGLQAKCITLAIIFIQHSLPKKYFKNNIFLVNTPTVYVFLRAKLIYIFFSTAYNFFLNKLKKKVIHTERQYITHMKTLIFNNTVV